MTKAMRTAENLRLTRDFIQRLNRRGPRPIDHGVDGACYETAALERALDRIEARGRLPQED